MEEPNTRWTCSLDSTSAMVSLFWQVPTSQFKRSMNENVNAKHTDMPRMEYKGILQMARKWNQWVSKKMHNEPDMITITANPVNILRITVAIGCAFDRIRQMITPPMAVNRIPKYTEKKVLKLISANVQFTTHDTMIPNTTPPATFSSALMRVGIFTISQNLVRNLAQQPVQTSKSRKTGRKCRFNKARASERNQLSTQPISAPYVFTRFFHR